MPKLPNYNHPWNTHYVSQQSMKREAEGLARIEEMTRNGTLFQEPTKPWDIPPPEEPWRPDLLAPGAQVELTGLSKRKDLNGLAAKVIRCSTDRHGYLTVRLPDTRGHAASGASAGAAATAWRTMRVNPTRLKPLGQSMSLSNLPGATSSLGSRSESRGSRGSCLSLPRSASSASRFSVLQDALGASATQAPTR
eukprot:TRINITY_DN8707_c0_g1_i5.p2 TRINITY_DN8707_c0_g1~~TRINITY_DN8707_c0_g1_i5.p2  ORF type:complete len:194 (+),score=38.29 TRINITY_DN8707_c0_g1_i5:231-812(+)